MTDKEFRKLKRIDLLELLMDLSKENEALRTQLRIVSDQLSSKEIAIQKAGSIAEASLVLSGIFEAAQTASAQYLENIQRLSGEQERICAEREKQSKADAAKILQAAQEECMKMRNETVEKCNKMLASADAKAKAYVERVTIRMNSILKERVSQSDNMENEGTPI